MTAPGVAPAASTAPAPGRVLSIAEIVQLVGDNRIGFREEFPDDKRMIRIVPVTLDPARRVGAKPDGTGGARLADPVFGGTVPPFTITKDEWMQRQMVAASVIFAESGGRADARCYNVNDKQTGKPKCSPVGPAGPRGYDRGIFQFNTKAWPAIPDEAADNPEAAAMIAFVVTRGWKQWGPWTGSRGLDPSSEPSKTVAAEFESQFGVVRDDTFDFVPDVITDWAKALGILLGKLVNPAWWRRVGVFMLGAVLITLAVALILAPEAVKVAGELL